MCLIILNIDGDKNLYEECRLLGRYAVVVFVRTDVPEERIASIIRVTRIGELGTTLAVTSNRSSYCQRCS
jgi:hypothetical protein